MFDFCWGLGDGTSQSVSHAASQPASQSVSQSVTQPVTQSVTQSVSQERGRDTQRTHARTHVSSVVRRQSGTQPVSQSREETHARGQRGQAEVGPGGGLRALGDADGRLDRLLGADLVGWFWRKGGVRVRGDGV